MTNHPIGGPVLAGPQIQPWTCQETATDEHCNEPPTFKFFYLPKGSSRDWQPVPGVQSNGDGGAFQPYDPESPPSPDDIETAKTTEGVEVPFIIRLETGYLDRDQYAVATLFDPEKPWTANAPQKQFNRRLVITHGFSCDTAYETGEAPNVLPPKVLEGGFVVASHALDHAGHNCNLLTQAESLVMTKEYVVDHYGTLRWTIGSGCSGGSLVQQQVANAYPGIYQGITPQCSFTDAWSSAMQYEEYFFGLQYLENPMRWGPGVVYDPVATNAFFDHPNPANPVTFTTVIPNSGEPTRSCPGRPRGAGLRREHEPDGRALHAAGLHGQRVRPRLERVGAPRLRRCRRAVRPEGTERRTDLAGAVRRLQHEHRRRRPRPQHHGGADGGRPDRVAAPVPHGRDQLGEQPRQGGDHRPARAGPRLVPRRRPDLLHARAAHAQLRDGQEPDPLARPGAARGRSLVRTGRGLRGRQLARACRRRPPQDLPRPQDHRGQAGGRRRPLHRRPGQRAVGRRLRPDGPGVRDPAAGAQTSP